MTACDYCGADAKDCGGQLCVSPGCLKPMKCSERCQREACPMDGCCRMHPECCEHDEDAADLTGTQSDEDRAANPR